MITLKQLRELALSRADMVESNFRSTIDLNYMINKSTEELYDLIVGVYENHYIKEIHMSTSNNTLVLPSDFYKLIGLDFKMSNDTYYNVSSFNFNERNTKNNVLSYNLYGINDIKYKIIGNSITLIPTDRSQGEYRVYYIPRCEELSLDTDTLTHDLDTYSEYIVIDVAIKLLQQEQSDVSVLAGQKAVLAQRVMTMTSNRDVSNPQTISDTNKYYDHFWRY